MNKLKKISLGKLFDNNKFVFAVSVVLAFVIWLSFSMYGGEQQEKTVEVPIQMDSMTVPKQFNLQQFGDYSNSAVTVTVVGKKAVIGTVNKDDIKVTASTLDVNTAGKHTLPLSVSVDSSKDFQILSTNTLSVEVYFDIYKEVNIAVTADLSSEPTVPDGYQLGTIILSSDKLLAYGPSTEVSKIDKILAKADIDDSLTKTETYPATIVAVDKYGNEIQNISMKDADDFTVTIPVFKLETLPVDVDFSNMPDGITKDDLNIKYSVHTLRIAGEPATIDSMQSVSVGTIDFSELKDTENTFTFDSDSIAGIKVVTKVSSITVSVDLSGFVTKTVKLPKANIEIANSTDKTVKIRTSSINVKLAGINSTTVNAITADNISAVLKVDDSLDIGENQKAAINVKVKGLNGIWTVGEYSVEVDVS